MRWIIDEPTDGAANMARDEALLQRVGAGESPPTLRFYRWSPATISLGYFQQFEECAALEPPAGELDVVRRQTGGGAILHDLELTYSLTLPLDHPLIGSDSPNRLYHHVHDAVASVLSEMGIETVRGPGGAGGCSQRGPFFCFGRHCCFDLIADGRKILGSAQRRTATTVLQHGSLILARRFDQQPCAAVADFTDADFAAQFAPLAARIAGHELQTGDWLPAEHQLADTLRAKYADPAWTRKR